MGKKHFLQIALEEMGIFSYNDYKEKIEIWEDFDLKFGSKIGSNSVIARV